MTEYITYPYDDKLWQQAEEWYEFSKLKDSVTEGEGEVAGALGEIVFAHHFKVDPIATCDYDMIVRGKKIEVKTKRTNYEARDHYFASVFNYNTRQQCDYYCFARVNEVKKEVYLLGWLGKRKFFTLGQFFKKDDIDPTSGKRRFPFTDDCFNVPLCKLRSIESLEN